MRKRMLAMLMCVAMALSLLPMSALAAGTKTTAGWAQAYREYIQEDMGDYLYEYGESYAKYCLFDGNGDSTPELYIDHFIAAAGRQICTYADGNVYTEWLDGHGGLSYLPGENIILDSGGHMDIYYDTVYSIKSGQFVQTADGEYGLEDISNIQFDENGDFIYQYFWNGKAVDKAAYEKNLRAVFPTNRAVDLDNEERKTYEEILEILDQTEEPTPDLKQQYIKEHVEYANSDAFRKEIVPGYGPLLRSIVDDVNRNNSITSYNFLSDVSDIVSFDLNNFDKTKEYEFLLAQILFDKNAKSAIEKSYQECYAEALLKLGNILIETDEFLDSIGPGTKEAIRSALSSISAADPGSQKFNNECGRLFDIVNGYDNVDFASRFLKKADGAGLDFLAGLTIDVLKQSCDTMDKLLMYLAAGEAYSKTSDAFGDVILAMRWSLPVFSEDNTFFNPISQPTVTEHELLHTLGLKAGFGYSLNSSDPLAPVHLPEIARALENFYTGITSYKSGNAQAIANDAVEEMVNGVTEAFASNSAKAVVSLFSGLPVVREYEVIKTLLSSGKFAVDVLTNIDDQAYLGTTMLRLCALSYILQSTITNSSDKPVGPEENQLNWAITFDESINMYKSITSVASEYGAQYAKACLKAANESILSFNKKEDISWYSTAISIAMVQKAACEDIHCHSVDYNPDTEEVTYSNSKLKVYTVACPVDVTVKTDTGKRIAFLSNRGTFIADGYEKYFHTVESKKGTGDYIKVAVVPESYEVTLQGIGAGTMNAYVADLKDGEIQQSGGFYDIPVTQNTEGRFISGGSDSLDDLILNGKTLEAVSDSPFKDVAENAWYYNNVLYVYQKQMMNGVSENRFAPNATTTRGMIVTILHRLEGTPTADASGFTDVEKGTWYQDAVDWAAANGIVNGTSETTFAPNAPITREQMAAILYRYADFKGYDVSQKADLSKYQDQSTIGAYAKDSMAWANAAGLITGVTDTTLSPRDSAIRAQVAAILMRFCEGVAK